MKKTKKGLSVIMVFVMLFGFFGFYANVQAANPYLPLWEHIPDGEPRLFEDPDNPGKYRVYIYGSHDTIQTQYCGYDLVTWSAPADDLNNWRYDGKIFESIVNGKADLLYAPDVVEVKEADGTKTYYLYPNNQASGRKSMIAKSKRPDGPFEVTNWKEGSNKTETVGNLGFDPAVFVDDDGRVYGYWGFEQSNAAELDPATMSSVKPGTQVISNMVGNSNNVPAGNNFRFYEASSMRKVKGKYVFIYSRKTNNGEYGLDVSNNTLAYAYGDTPLGPWTYGGTLVDARGPVLDQNGLMTTSQPYGNTHGSILEVNGQWYVFYHRRISTNEYSRQEMVAPINVDVTADGKVVITGLKTVKDIKGNEYTGAEVTSEGFELHGLNPFEYHSAGISSFLINNSYVKTTYDTWQDDAPVINNKNNSIVGYKYFNFNEKPVDGQSTQLELYITPKGVDGTIDIMLDNPWTAQGGTKIGTLNISKDAAQQKTKMVVPVPAIDVVDGKHGIYFVFSSKSTSVISDLNGLKFSFTQSLLLNETFTSGLDNWKINAGSPTVGNGLVLTNAASVTSKIGEDWKNYEFVSNVNLSQGTVGLRFLQSDDKNYYELQLKDGNLELSSVLYGTKTVLKKASNAFKTNESASVSIAKVDNTITVRINGIIVLQQQNKDHDIGTVGIFSYDGSSAKISSVLVQNSQEKETVPATNSISVNGVQLENFVMSVYDDYSTYEKKYKLPAGTTDAPIVTASSSDEDVKVSISQADNPKGTAVVRFIKEGSQVKTYKIHFAIAPGNAFDKIKAPDYTNQSGTQLETCSNDADCGEDVGFIQNGSYLEFDNIDFGSGAAWFEARVASGASGGNIEIRLDGLSGTLVGTCSVSGTGGWQTWVTQSCSVSGATGKHNLYLKFTGGSGYLFNVNWFRFYAHGPTSYAVNTGGVAADGLTADQAYKFGSWGYSGTTSTYTSEAAVSPNYGFPNAFKTQRNGNTFNYRFPLENGNYTVKLYFAESYFSGAGKRVFNVSVNSVTKLSDFDIYTAAGGGNKGVEKVFTGNSVTDGFLSIGFTAIKDTAMINAIVIQVEPDKQLVGITAPAPITGVANGTAKTAAALGLPSTVELITDAGSMNADVTWDVDASSYDPSLKTAQTFTVNGTVTLPERVKNPNGVALTTSIRVTVNAIAKQAGSLRGTDKTNAGASFDMTYGLQNVKDTIYAQNLTIQFDPAKVEFLSAESTKEGFAIVGQDVKAGQVRLLAASLGETKGVNADGDLLKLHWKANTISESAATAIILSKVTISNGDGVETQLEGVSHNIAITNIDKSALNDLIVTAQAEHNAAVEGTKIGQYPAGSKAALQAAINSAKAVADNADASQADSDQAKASLSAALDVFNASKISNILGDLNGDGKVSIADLAIMAKWYGISSKDPDWGQYKIADLNGDGVIDIADMAIVARLILGD